MDHMEHIWADLPSSLLQQIMLACLPSEPLHFNRLLLPGSPDAAAAAAEQRVITVFSSTCRAWAAAAAQALQLAAWSVKAQCPAAAAADLLEQLGERRVAALDLRWLTWSEACGSGVAEALLSSLQRRSGACLQSAVGVPERLCAALAAGFPGLATVGLSEDYASTERKAHSAPMQLAPLRALRHLRRLQMELGVVELASIPSQVTALQLIEVDRLVVPPAAGASVADRLLAAAEAAGLEYLCLEAASGCVVFEEANHAPLELELSHVARLLAAAAGMPGRQWHVALSVRSDAAVGQRRPCLELRAAAPAAAGEGE